MHPCIDAYMHRVCTYAQVASPRPGGGDGAQRNWIYIYIYIYVYPKGYALCRRPLCRQVTSELQRSGKGNAGLFYICYVLFPWNEFSGTLPTRFDENDPYGRGGMLAFFLSGISDCRSQKLQKSDNLGVPGVPF